MSTPPQESGVYKQPEKSKFSKNRKISVKIFATHVLKDIDLKSCKNPECNLSAKFPYLAKKFDSFITLSEETRVRRRLAKRAVCHAHNLSCVLSVGESDVLSHDKYKFFSAV